MSRKFLLVVIAVLGAIAALLTQTFGLSPDMTAATVGLGAILVYVFNEAKADCARMRAQADKWKDPKFWITFASGIIAALGTAGVNIPAPEVIIGILTFIVGILFKAKPSPAVV
jgi:hypothetical protein